MLGVFCNTLNFIAQFETSALGVMESFWCIVPRAAPAKVLPSSTVEADNKASKKKAVK